MSQEQYKIQSTLLKVGKAPVSIQQAGSYFRLLRVSPSPNVITLKTDEGTEFQLTPGMGIPAKFHSFTLACANNVRDITVTFFVGTTPLVDTTSTQPASTLITVDTVTIGGAGQNGISMVGTLTVEGTTYRRQKATFVNLDTALLAAVESLYTARNAFTAIGTAFGNNGANFPLSPATGANLFFPQSVETDDTLFLAPGQNGAAFLVTIIQTWIPIIQ